MPRSSLSLLLQSSISRNTGESSGFVMRPSLPSELLQRASEPFRWVYPDMLLVSFEITTPRIFTISTSRHTTPHNMLLHSVTSFSSFLSIALFCSPSSSLISRRSAQSTAAVKKILRPQRGSNTGAVQKCCLRHFIIINSPCASSLTSMSH